MVFVQWDWHGVRSPFVHWTPPGGSCPKLGSRLNPRNKFDIFPALRSIQCLLVTEFVLIILAISYALLFQPDLSFLGLSHTADKNVWGAALFVFAVTALSSVAALESARS